MTTLLKPAIAELVERCQKDLPDVLGGIVELWRMIAEYTRMHRTWDTRDNYRGVKLDTWCNVISDHQIVLRPLASGHKAYANWATASSAQTLAMGETVMIRVSQGRHIDMFRTGVRTMDGSIPSLKHGIPRWMLDHDELCIDRSGGIVTQTGCLSDVRPHRMDECENVISTPWVGDLQSAMKEGSFLIRFHRGAVGVTCSFCKQDGSVVMAGVLSTPKPEWEIVVYVSFSHYQRAKALAGSTFTIEAVHEEEGGWPSHHL